VDLNGLTSHIAQGTLRDMRTAAPPLLPIFRSRLQGELLAAILLDPERSESLTDLARGLEADVGTIQREVSRFERAGILQTRRVGNTRLVRANTASPIYRPLAELVLKAFGPAQVVAEEFAKIRGTKEIYIFGSWAARYQGEEGPTPADVDVLVIGSPDRDDVYQAALRSESRLGREVNTTIRSKASWRSARDGFIRQVRSSPIVPVRPPDHARTQE
jgi:predicted nucleotidyltransferase